MTIKFKEENRIVEENREEKDINHQLRNERLKRNWTQQDLADRLGTTVVSIKRWENKKTVPNLYFRAKLSELFDKNIHELGLQKEQEEQNELQSELKMPERQSTPSSSFVWRNFFFPLESKRGKVLAIVGLLALVLLFLMRFVVPLTLYPNREGISSGTVRTPGGARNFPEATVAINDSLTSQSSDGQWTTGQDCRFVDGALRIMSSGANYCSANKQTFTNMVFHMRMTIMRGGWAGITFRADDQSNMYYFSLDTKAHYEVDALTPGYTKKLVQGTNRAIIEGYGRTNIIQVEANKTQLSFWVNNVLVGVVEDKTYITGYVGICVGNYDNAADPKVTEAVYRDAYVQII
jgi:transcriptional regulator with XRE-family HTH domain